MNYLVHVVREECFRAAEIFRLMTATWGIHSRFDFRNTVDVNALHRLCVCGAVEVLRDVNVRNDHQSLSTSFGIHHCGHVLSSTISECILKQLPSPWKDRDGNLLDGYHCSLGAVREFRLSRVGVALQYHLKPSAKFNSTDINDPANIDDFYKGHLFIEQLRESTLLDGAESFVYPVGVPQFASVKTSGSAQSVAIAQVGDISFQPVIQNQSVIQNTVMPVDLSPFMDAITKQSEIHAQSNALFNDIFRHLTKPQYTDADYSRLRSKANWLWVLNELGDDISDDTFSRWRASGKYLEHPNTKPTDKSIRLLKAKLPPTYSDEMDTNRTR